MVAWAVCLSACGEGSRPRYGGELCYVRNHPGEGLDPVLIRYDNATREVAGLIYEGLVGLAPRTYELVPLLAESWELSPDRKALTFHLRRGVRFQDDPCFPGGRGREVTAWDVKYSWERNAGWRGDTWGYEAFRLVQGAEEFREGRAGHISGIEVLGEHLLRVKFVRPDFAFLYAISGPRGYVVPREAVERYGEGFPEHPVGTGPFRLALWKQGEEMLLVRNEGYWGRDSEGRRLPYLDAIRIYDIRTYPPWPGPEEFSEGTGLGINVIFELTSSNLEALLKEARRLGLERMYKHYFTTIYLSGFILFTFKEGSPFSRNVYLRKALLAAYPEEKNFVAEGHRRLVGLLPSDFPGADTTLPERTCSLELAKELLAEAGYPGGEGLPPVRFFKGAYTVRSFPALKEAGFRPELTDDLQDADLFYSYWLAEYPDPQSFLELLYSGCDLLGTKYHSALYDSLYEELRSEFDPGRRRELSLKLQRILVEDAVGLFLFQEENYYIARFNIRNLDICFNPFRIRFFKYVWIE